MLTSLGGALALLACNGILGIEEAALKPDAAAGGSVGTGGGSGTLGTGGPSSGGDSGHTGPGDSSSGASGTAGVATCDASGVCSQAHSPSCNNCLLVNCRSQLDACLAQSTCRRDLIEYSSDLRCSCCVDQGFQVEELAGGSPESNDFANCLQDHCVDTSPACVGQGLSCLVYCHCMNNLPFRMPMASCDTQKNAVWGSRTCEEYCMDAPSLPCQAEHCGIASTSLTQSAVDLHCGHAVGISCCDAPRFECSNPKEHCQ